MALLSLYLFSIAGGVIWAFNVETAAIVYGGQFGYHPLVVGSICGAGQATAYLLLFLFGDFLFLRWAWARKQTDKLRAKWGKRLETSFLGLTAPAALFGLPPMTCMAAVAPGFKVRMWSMLAIALPLRMLRFTLLSVFGAQLVSWWRAL